MSGEDTLIQLLQATQSIAESFTQLQEIIAEKLRSTTNQQGSSTGGAAQQTGATGRRFHSPSQIQTPAFQAGRSTNLASGSARHHGAGATSSLPTEIASSVSASLSPSSGLGALSLDSGRVQSSGRPSRWDAPTAGIADRLRNIAHGAPAATTSSAASRELFPAHSMPGPSPTDQQSGPPQGLDGSFHGIGRSSGPVNLVASDTRSQKLIDIDRRFAKVVDQPRDTVFQTVHTDLSSRLTRQRLEQTLELFLSTCENDMAAMPILQTTLTELDSLLRELNGLNGGVGPADAAWGRVVLCVQMAVQFVKVKLLQCQNDSLKAGVTALATHDGAESVVSSFGQSDRSMDKMLLGSIPMFEGKEFDAWLDHFENVVVHQLHSDLARIKQSLAVKLGPRYTSRARALQDLGTWEEVKSALMAEFSATPGVVDLSVAWASLSQGDMTLADYNNHVLSLLYRTQGNPHPSYDVNHITAYIKGLTNLHTRQKLLQDVMSKGRNKSLQQFMDKALSSARVYQLAVNMGGGAPGETTVEAAAAAKTGRPAASSAPSSASHSELLDPDEICYRHPGHNHRNKHCKAKWDVCPCCGESVGQQALKDGHIKKKCKAPVCSACGKKNHRADQCYMKFPHMRPGAAAGSQIMDSLLKAVGKAKPSRSGSRSPRRSSQHRNKERTSHKRSASGRDKKRTPHKQSKTDKTAKAHAAEESKKEDESESETSSLSGSE